MRLTVTHHWCPKHGNSDAEYEDAIRWNSSRRRVRRFAVADGASESSFARWWARLLVEGYTEGTLSAHALNTGLRPLQRRWREAATAKPLPWYAAAKMQSGAFAALVGLTLLPGGIWRALAVGDCCLLHLRAGALLCSFPLTNAAQFDNRPLLLSSNPERNAHLADGPPPLLCGTWQSGDRFLLISDALAAYVLRAIIDEQRPPAHALPPGGGPGFRAWVATLRAERLLRNDDCALLRVEVL